MKTKQPKSQVQRIQEIGLGRWLDEPMNLDEYYGKPSDKPPIFKRFWAWITGGKP